MSIIIKPVEMGKAIAGGLRGRKPQPARAKRPGPGRVKSLRHCLTSKLNEEKAGEEIYEVVGIALCPLNGRVANPLM